MLILTRKETEEIDLEYCDHHGEPQKITITVVETRKGSVRIGIDAQSFVRITRPPLSPSGLSGREMKTEMSPQEVAQAMFTTMTEGLRDEELGPDGLSDASGSEADHRGPVKAWAHQAHEDKGRAYEDLRASGLSDSSSKSYGSDAAQEAMEGPEDLGEMPTVAKAMRSVQGYALEEWEGAVEPVTCGTCGETLSVMVTSPWKGSPIEERGRGSLVRCPCGVFRLTWVG